MERLSQCVHMQMRNGVKRRAMETKSNGYVRNKYKD